MMVHEAGVKESESQRRKRASYYHDSEIGDHVPRFPDDSDANIDPFARAAAIPT